MTLKWIRTEKNTYTRWDAELNGFRLVIVKTPGYDPGYGVYKDGEELHSANIWSGTVKDCKEAAIEKARLL